MLAVVRLRFGRRCVHSLRKRGATWRRLELEDGGFCGLPGGQRRDSSAASHPPLGEATARA